MVGVKDKSDEEGIVLFKYKGLTANLLGMGIIILGASFLMGIAPHRDHSYQSWFFLAPFILMFLFGNFLCISNLTDIQISSQAISRHFCRWTVQKIEWTNIKVIRVFEVHSRQQRKMCLVMHICPHDTKKMQAWLLYRKKIVLSDSPMSRGRFSELITVLNTYIPEYHINIESTVGGVTSRPDCLAFIPKRADWDPIDWYNR
jgi:hypothetical protein